MKTPLRRRSHHGYTVVELMLALFIAFIVMLGIGKMMVINQKMWQAGAEQVQLQQEVSHVLERLGSSIRNAHSLESNRSDEFLTRSSDGTLKHRYDLSPSSEGYRLQEDGKDLCEASCLSFECAPNADNTYLLLTIELEDRAGNRVSGMTRVAVRNTTLAF
jgi:competence protein ComGC